MISFILSCVHCWSSSWGMAISAAVSVNNWRVNIGCPCCIHGCCIHGCCIHGCWCLCPWCAALVFIPNNCIIFMFIHIIIPTKLRAFMLADSIDSFSVVITTKLSALSLPTCPGMNIVTTNCALLHMFVTCILVNVCERAWVEIWKKVP